MTDVQRCPAISEKRVQEAVADTRDRYLSTLRGTCAAEGLDAEGAVGAALASRLAAFLDHFLPMYVKADLSARHHRHAYARASTLVFTLGALAVIVVSAQYLFHLPHVLVVGEVLCIGSILLIFHWGNHRRWHRNWVDCRYFAERLRCGLHVAFLCGKTVVPEGPAWAERMVEGAWCNPEYGALMSARPHPEPLSAAGLPVLRRFMIDEWLQRQVAYHRRVATNKLRKHHVVSRIGETCFWLTLIAALLHLTPHSWRHAWQLERVLTDHALTFAVIALPAVGTALAGVRGHFEFKKIATRARMIADHLDALVEDGRKVDDLAELSLVVLRAEELMMQENAGWHLHANAKTIPSEA